MKTPNLRDNAAEAIDDEAAQPIPTGLKHLDNGLMGGMRHGQLIVIAGHTSHGASTTAHTIAQRVAADRQVAIVALESTAHDVARRVLAAQTKTPLHHIQRMRYTEDESERVTRMVWNGEPSLRLWLSDTVRSIDTIETELNGDDRAPELLVIDGAHLLAPSHDYGGRAQFADDDARRLKEFAVQRGMVVIATLPLETSGAYNRIDHRPMLQDFGKRQAYLHAADIVILPWRPDAVEYEDPRAGEIDLMVAKNRNGVRFMAVAAFQGHYARVVTMEREARTPEPKTDFGGLLDSFFDPNPNQP
jgi:replicative DNA helicase